MAGLNEIPTIRLTIESMRHEILYAFMKHQGNMAEEIDKQLARTIEDFNFEAEVKHVADKMIAEMVEKIVKDTVFSLQYDIDFKADMQKLAMRGIRRKINKKAKRE